MRHQNIWLLPLLLLIVVVGVLTTMFLLETPNTPRPEVIPEQAIVPDESVEATKEAVVTIEETLNKAGTPVDTREDEEWQIIATYYGLLPSDLAKAYAMRSEGSVSLKTFEEWYGHVKFSWTRDPHVIEPHTYRFFVNLIEERPSETSLYQVIMRVNGQKLETISADKLEYVILSTVARPNHKGQKAWVTYDEGVESVYIDVGQSDVLVASVNRNAWNPFGGGDAFQTIERIEFSESGDYLTVSYGGWEGTLLEVYEIGSNKKVHSAGSPYQFGFDPENESWFAECQGSGMSMGYIRVYDLPEWTTRYEYQKETDSAIGDCSINTGQEVLFSVIMFEPSSGTSTETYWRYIIQEDKLVPQE